LHQFAVAKLAISRLTIEHDIGTADRGSPEGFRAEAADKRRTICVVGSGRRFLSGISYYTHEVAVALSARFEVSVVLVRRLIPALFYPGRQRVGQHLSDLDYPADVRVFDGVDWFWGPSIWQCLAFLRSQPPDFVIFEWWTGAVLHTYLLIAVFSRLRGARVIIEFHEVQDVGEQRIPLVGLYVSCGFPLLLRMASGSVVHSEHDREALRKRFGRELGVVATVPHAPYDFHKSFAVGEGTEVVGTEAVTHLLYFGVIRPFKGVDDLIAAFNSLSPAEAGRFRLTVVGETWEGFDVRSLVDSSPHRHLISFVNRYVHDEELAGHLQRADVVVLPYHRSSSSGPLSVAMGVGLPVIVSRVGGLVEAAAGYGGAIFVEPRDIGDLRRALLRAESLRGERFPCKGSWHETAAQIAQLLTSIDAVA
jgi:glycosyltransferase involved in cell wall biosynthesis